MTHKAQLAAKKFVSIPARADDAERITIHERAQEAETREFRAAVGRPLTTFLVRRVA